MVIRDAGWYLTEATEDGQAVVRLYHQAIADYLRQEAAPAAEAEVEDVITRRLRKLAEADGWPRANPYTARHLASHAAASTQLPDLAGDLGYLAAADPDGLAAALGTGLPPSARLYLRCAHDLRGRAAGERAAVLALTRPAARRGPRPHPAAWGTVVAAVGALPAHRLPPSPPRPHRPGERGSLRRPRRDPVAVTVSNDGTARVWDLATGAALTMPIAGCNGLAVCGTTLLAATHLGVIAIDLRAGQHAVAGPPRREIPNPQSPPQRTSANRSRRPCGTAATPP